MAGVWDDTRVRDGVRAVVQLDRDRDRVRSDSKRSCCSEGGREWQPMRLWLSRQRDGKYMLTQHKPVVAEVGTSGTSDLYVMAGDPVGYRGMCQMVTEQIFGVRVARLDSVEVELWGREVTKDG